jgi:hypothetical protein
MTGVPVDQTQARSPRSDTRRGSTPRDGMLRRVGRRESPPNPVGGARTPVSTGDLSPEGRGSRRRLAKVLLRSEQPAGALVRPASHPGRRKSVANSGG